MVLMMKHKYTLMTWFKNIKPTGFLKRGWRLWAKALGEKIGEDKEADKIAMWRTMIILQAIITNVLISINILITWLK